MRKDDPELFELIKKTKEGSSEALEELFRRFVGIATIFKKRSGLSCKEFNQQVLLALYFAAQHYDGSRGTKFSSYAFYWFKRALLPRKLKESLGELDEEACLFDEDHSKTLLKEESTAEILQLIEEEWRKSTSASFTPYLMKEFLAGGKSLGELSKILGVSRQRLSQIQRKVSLRVIKRLMQKRGIDNVEDLWDKGDQQ